MTRPFDELTARVVRFRDDRDWARFHNPKDLALSISIEAAELMELFQWKDPDEIEKSLLEPERLERLKEEVADIVVFCLNMSNTASTSNDAANFRAA